MSRARLVWPVVSTVALIVLVLVTFGVHQCLSGRIRGPGTGAESPARGRVLAKQEWPRTLVDLLSDARQRQIAVGEIRVYQVSRDEYYWAFCGAAPDLFALMNERWKLCAVKKDEQLVRRFLQRMPTELLSSNHPNETAYHLSSNWLGGEKGDLYCVMNDDANRACVVRYYYNF